MWSDKLKKDAWWVVDGDNYIGPFNKWCDAKRLAADDVQKPFDITKHEFSDLDLSMRIDDVDRGVLTIKYFDNYHDLDDSADSTINKDDAIAIAKALGVTGEDLK